MAIIRYNPMKEIDTLQRQMNHLFEDFFPTLTENHFAYSPAAEISETNEAYYLKLDLPGMKAEDLDIQVGKDTIAISGERKEENKTENNGVTRSEFRYGKFQRVIPLPGMIQNTNVTAQYQDGILTLTLPKAEEEKNKVVKVQIG